MTYDVKEMSRAVFSASETVFCLKTTREVPTLSWTPAGVSAAPAGSRRFSWRAKSLDWLNENKYSKGHLWFPKTEDSKHQPASPVARHTLHSGEITFMPPAGRLRTHVLGHVLCVIYPPGALCVTLLPVLMNDGELPQKTAAKVCTANGRGGRPHLDSVHSFPASSSMNLSHKPDLAQPPFTPTEICSCYRHSQSISYWPNRQGWRTFRTFFLSWCQFQYLDFDAGSIMFLFQSVKFRPN